MIDNGFGGGTLEGRTQFLDLKIEAGLFIDYSNWADFMRHPYGPQGIDKAFYSGLYRDVAIELRRVIVEHHKIYDGRTEAQKDEDVVNLKAIEEILRNERRK